MIESHLEEIIITYSFDSSRGEVHLHLEPDSNVGHVIARAKEEYSLQGENPSVEGWEGATTGGEWSLRENRSIEEGKWWTEAEVEGYQGPIISSNQPIQHWSYELIPPYTPLITANVTIPTTTSDSPVTVRLPFFTLHTFGDLLDTLKDDLGLPTSTSDLVSNRTRGERSRSRSRSHVSSIFDTTGSESSSREREDGIQWKIIVLEDGSFIANPSLTDNVFDAFRDHTTAILMIKMDDAWLLEKTKCETPELANDTEEESDTLKASSTGQSPQVKEVKATTSPAPSFHGGTSSSARLSGLFHGWLDANQHPAPPPSPQLSIVSGQGAARTPLNLSEIQDALNGETSKPLLAQLRHARPPSGSAHSGTIDANMTSAFGSAGFTQTLEIVESVDEDQWEDFLDDLNLHGTKRDAMNNLSAERRAYLLAQNRQVSLSTSTMRQTPATPTSSSASDVAAARSASFISLSAGTSLGLSRLLPQLTSGSTESTKTSNSTRETWTKRLSLASLGSWTSMGATSTPNHLGVPEDEGGDGETTPRAEVNSLTESTFGDRGIEKQYTGGLWGWWTGSSKPEEGSPAHFVERLKDAKASSIALNKHLISLRVRLSTAKISFLHDFLHLAGLDALSEALGRILASSIGQGDTPEQNVVEIIKCLRVLMNTDAGFTGVLDRPVLLLNTARTLHLPTLRLRCQSADLLSALCVLSPYEGHGLVVSALSDEAVHGIQLRFHCLISSLDVSWRFNHDSQLPDNEDLWLWRTSVLALLNAIANTPDNLDERCALRGEMDRRGLTSAIEVLQHYSLPKSLLAQVNLYLEESKEDWAELRWLNLSESDSGLHAAAAAVIKTVQGKSEVEEAILNLLQRIAVSLGREVNETVKLQVITLLSKFGEHVLDILDL